MMVFPQWITIDYCTVKANDTRRHGSLVRSVSPKDSQHFEVALWFDELSEPILITDCTSHTVNIDFMFGRI